MEQRRNEILAKKAKLAELKRQREVRQRESSTGRPSFGGVNDVGSSKILRAKC
jgi:dynein intermediate chain